MLTNDTASFPLASSSLVNDSQLETSRENSLGEKNHILNLIIASRLNHNGPMSLKAFLNFLSYHLGSRNSSWLFQLHFWILPVLFILLVNQLILSGAHLFLSAPYQTQPVTINIHDHTSTF